MSVASVEQAGDDACNRTGHNETGATWADADDLEILSWHGYLDTAIRAYHALNRTLHTAHALSLLDVILLDFLMRSPDGAARMGDLAQAVVLMPGRVTQQVRRLEGQGLLRRIASERDKRSVLAQITPAGRARMRLALRTYAGWVRVHYLDPLSRRQVTAIGDSCRRISTALRESGTPTGR
ncbi:MarR family transcriptional regulator [Mycolicibacterium farcinogenes]|jgi:DNA-binding MarR family transcriptional regulator|uniref:MarR family transcriptional regulator n=1 Tax=Mycolicibacterium farcinogenes TaxID=1802 RepID=A0ACD1FDC8_MYCFR|nr:MarR family transcriptional regulator [Mycolicibacterium farcinogenes]QZH65068.1 MarR family transcriptional regulator [Mycolicibacterium farcinogenes]